MKNLYIVVHYSKIKSAGTYQRNVNEFWEESEAKEFSEHLVFSGFFDIFTHKGQAPDDMQLIKDGINNLYI